MTSLTLTMDGMDDCQAATLVGILRGALAGNSRAVEYLSEPGRPALVVTVDADMADPWTASLSPPVVHRTVGGMTVAGPACGATLDEDGLNARRDVARVTCPACLSWTGFDQKATVPAAPECGECGMTLREMDAAAWWAGVDRDGATCCEVPV